MNAGAVELRGVRKSYAVGARRLDVLRDVDLDAQPGEFLSVVGASGCGKSTLLRLVSGLESADGGHVLVDRAPVEGPGLDRGIVFQDHRLLPWLRVEENVALALHANPLDAAARRTRVRDYLRLVGLEGFEKALPEQLSGGMAQRAAIARALVNSPRVLLLDEPFAALDAITKSYLHDELLKIWAVERTTVLLVTHDIEEAVYLSDRVVVMGRNPGHVHEIVSIDLPRPRRRDDLRLYQLKAQILARFAPGGADS